MGSVPEGTQDSFGVGDGGDLAQAVEVAGAQVGGQAGPQGAAFGDGVRDGVDAEQGHAAQDEGHDGGGQVGAAGEAAGGHGSSIAAAASALPVEATTSKPRPARMSTATLPTPPVAPVTRTGPSSGVRPWSSSVTTLSAAVNPAVPMVAASSELSPSRRTTQSAGTWAY